VIIPCVAEFSFAAFVSLKSAGIIFSNGCKSVSTLPHEGESVISGFLSLVSEGPRAKSRGADAGMTAGSPSFPPSLSLGTLSPKTEVLLLEAFHFRCGWTFSISRHDISLGEFFLLCVGNSLLFCCWVRRTFFGGDGLKGLESERFREASSL